MKKITLFLAALLLGAGSIAPALADAPVCLRSQWIDRTTVVNPTTILFRMKDGKVWRNTLKSPCLGLKFNGFVYVLHGSDEICGEVQSIRVLRTNEVCILGPFTPEVVNHAQGS
jgi:hypothetical protein